MTPHTSRHTGIAWLAIEGKDPYGITMEVYEKVYAHHDPDYMTGIRAGFTRHRQKPDKFDATKREQTGGKVVKIG